MSLKLVDFDPVDYLKTEKIGIKNKYRAVAMTENKV